MVRCIIIQSQIAMKTQPYHPARQRNTRSLLGVLTWALIIYAALFFVTSCAVPVAIRVPGQFEKYGYSSKSGLSIELQRAFK